MSVQGRGLALCSGRQMAPLVLYKLPSPVEWRKGALSKPGSDTGVLEAPCTADCRQRQPRARGRTDYKR